MNVSQLLLFDLETGVPSANGKPAFADPAFAGNKSLPVHRWVPWIAGFARDFVGGVLESHMRTPGTVLDPFTGVGTTLVEALLSGHQAIGFEINPYAALAARTKLRAHATDLASFIAAIRDFSSYVEGAAKSGQDVASAPPPGFRTRGEFYSTEVLRKVLIVHDFMGTLDDGLIRDLFRLAFASTMVTYSNYSYEPSLGQRASAGREGVSDYPVATAIQGKLIEMAADIKWLQAQAISPPGVPEVINDSFFRNEDHIPAESVDLIITSPPYLNNYHYNRNTRPHLYWLGFAKSPQDLEPLEQDNFGKFWQTVREKEPIGLTFPASRTDLEDRLDALRAINPERGIYGGNGWANYAACYFNDCYRFALGIQRVLRPGGSALVVIGNSILQGIMIPTDQYFAAIAEAVGLERVRIEIPRSTRVGNSIIQSNVRVGKASRSEQLYEAIVELRRR